MTSLKTLWNGAKKELPKLLLQGTVSALGFLLALLINGWVEQKKEMNTYHSMLLAVRTEAAANQVVVNTSYQRYFLAGLVIREFRYSTATQLLGDPLFMKYATPADIQLLNDYIGHLSLANGYRRVAEPLMLQQPATIEAVMTPSGWLQSLEGQWADLLPSVQKDLDAAAKLKN
jgi:hypothetical protein